MALFDIDSTIMSTSRRNYRILREAAAEYTEIAPAVAALGPDDMGWNVVTALKSRMDVSQDLEDRIHNFWRDRFFTNEYVLEDRPYPGVTEILGWLRDAGCTLVYLTGRDEPGMAEGTVESFSRSGLPTADGTRFLFKPAFSISDIEFKREAIQAVRGIGPVWIVVENEPANANLFIREFPDATVLLIDTITAPNPERIDPKIIVFQGYAKTPDDLETAVSRTET